MKRVFSLRRPFHRSERGIVGLLRSKWRVRGEEGDGREERVEPAVGKRVRNGLRWKCLCCRYRERRRRAVQDEETRDDALGGFRTTVIAGLLRTLTIHLEATTGAEGQSVQNCTLFKTTARWIGGGPLPSFTKLGTGWDWFAVNLGGANSELRIIVGKGGDSETLLTSGIVSRV
jgi:hypothetical protein